MGLDLSRPLELEDGTPVELIGSSDGYVRVRLPSGPFRRKESNVEGHGGMIWSYDQRTGIFGGGDAKRFLVLRNAGPAVPEEYEEWFV